MKFYPSISKNYLLNANIIAFDKIDGSNIRAEWDSKKGFCKFGSRHQLIVESTPILGESILLIKNKYENYLNNIAQNNKWKSAVFFFEFYGPNSFAGQHVNENHDVILFDVNIFKIGMLDPVMFLKHFGHLDIPKTIYHGKCSDSFINDVKDLKFANISGEGVVCKTTEIPHKMFKIKTKFWLEKLKQYCKNDLNLFSSLS